MKYELVSDDFIEQPSHKLFRIRALMDFDDVKAGELGGYIEKEANLSQRDHGWVSAQAKVYGDAKVWGDARVSGDASVYGDAQVSGHAQISGQAHISGRARISGSARVKGHAWVQGDAWVFGEAFVSGDARVSDHAQIFGNTWLSENMRVSGHAWISGDKDVLWLANIAREYFGLTVYRAQSRIELTHEYFHGTPETFLQTVFERYGDSRKTSEYQLLIQFAQSRLQPDECLKEGVYEI